MPIIAENSKFLMKNHFYAVARVYAEMSEIWHQL